MRRLINVMLIILALTTIVSCQKRNGKKEVTQEEIWRPLKEHVSQTIYLKPSKPENIIKNPFDGKIEFIIVQKGKEEYIYAQYSINESAFPDSMKSDDRKIRLQINQNSYDLLDDDGRDTGYKDRLRIGVVNEIPKKVNIVITFESRNSDDVILYQDYVNSKGKKSKDQISFDPSINEIMLPSKELAIVGIFIKSSLSNESDIQCRYRIVHRDRRTKEETIFFSGLSPKIKAGKISYIPTTLKGLKYYDLRLIAIIDPIVLYADKEYEDSNKDNNERDRYYNRKEAHGGDYFLSEIKTYRNTDRYSLKCTIGNDFEGPAKLNLISDFNNSYGFITLIGQDYNKHTLSYKDNEFTKDYLEPGPYYLMININNDYIEKDKYNNIVKIIIAE